MQNSAVRWKMLLALCGCFFYAADGFAVCYYITTHGGEEYSSVYPPYDLTFPHDAPLSPAEIQRRQRIGHLSITFDNTGCSKEPFPNSLLAPPPPRNDPPPTRPPLSSSTLPTAPPPPTAPAPVARQVAAQTSSRQGMNINHLLDTLGAMDAALSRQDVQTYQLYLAAQLSINRANGEDEAQTKILSRADYVRDLQQQLQRVSSYQMSHQEPLIDIDMETNSATVISSVTLNGEYKNGLPIHTAYRETAVFVWDESLNQAVLKELSMQPETSTAEASQAAADKASDVEFCQGVTGLAVAECEVLVQFYTDTQGRYWEQTSGWLQNKAPCSWSGVTCAAERVVELKLIRKNLRGRLPNLSALTQLQVLDIEKNKLSGEVPDLSALTALKVVDLSRNSFLGALPDISSLNKLEVFEAHKNSFVGELPDFSRLTQLKELDVSSNQITGSIPDLSKLEQLRLLNLSNNRLSGALQGLSGLRALRELLLHKNNLSGTLTELGSLQQMRKLYLSDNQFSGELPDLSNLRWLEQLVVFNNQLSGQLPASLNQLNDIEWLQMNDNQFSGSIPDLSNLKRLKILNLANNQLCGVVPDWLLTSNLKRNTSNLTLFNNRLTANTPDMQQFLEEKEPGWATSQQAIDTCP